MVPKTLTTAPLYPPLSTHSSDPLFELPFYSEDTIKWLPLEMGPLEECKLVQPLWKTVWRFLRKLKIELPYDPAIPLLGMYPDKTIIQKDTCIPMFIAALFTIAKTWK